MKASDEYWLWRRMATGQSPRLAIMELVEAGVWDSPKPAHRTLEKWARAGLYEYGVALDLGWLVEGATFPRMQEVKS